jgi:hypothetical protein
MRVRKIFGVLAGLVLVGGLALAVPAAAGATGASPVPPPAPAVLPASAGQPLGTATAASITYEWNVASAGSAPSGDHTYGCTSRSGSNACFQPYGDHWSVQDTLADGHSATASWYDYHFNGSEYDLIREGSCVNERGHGTWGGCSKNYVEEDLIIWYACVYDAGDGTWHGCSDAESMYANS